MILHQRWHKDVYWYSQTQESFLGAQDWVRELHEQVAANTVIALAGLFCPCPKTLTCTTR